MSAYFSLKKKKPVHFIVNGDPSARYVLNMLLWFIKHPKWWQSSTVRNHAQDLKNSSHHLFLCMLKSQNSFYHTPASQLPACLPTTSAYIQQYYQLWRRSEYKTFVSLRTKWQPDKSLKQENHEHKYYALNTDINLRNLFLNTLKWTMTQTAWLEQRPISAFFHLQNTVLHCGRYITSFPPWLS